MQESISPNGHRKVEAKNPATREPITFELMDPLAEFLGTLMPGETFRYSYSDAVKLCGHSCLAVASAWRMLEVVLGRLFPHEIPVRGQLEVTVGGRLGDGWAGPQSQVFGLVTGAAADLGFRGLMGRWPRHGLLHFDESLGECRRFRRIDTGRTVEVVFVPPPDDSPQELRELVRTTLEENTSPMQRKRFRAAWQAGVRRILTADAEEIIRFRHLDMT